jgi:N12 class adenine-specific DNA methylase/SAM-dependent methyltransferase
MTYLDTLRPYGFLVAPVLFSGQSRYLFLDTTGEHPLLAREMGFADPLHPGVYIKDTPPSFPPDFVTRFSQARLYHPPQNALSAFVQQQVKAHLARPLVPSPFRVHLRPGERESALAAVKNTHEAYFVAGLKTLAAVEQARRPPTQAEAKHWLTMGGWGTVAPLFEPRGNRAWKWDALAAALEKTLDPEAWAVARRHTLYAHHTPDIVIEGLYKGLEHLGFRGGRVLEPGMGSGAFLALMPPALREQVDYVGVENDPTFVRILKQCFPEAQIHARNFIEMTLPPKAFDAVIGNPPYANRPVVEDKVYRAYRPLLHDYFLLKAIDALKPGGVLAFVTSTGTLDKQRTTVREALLETADLLGAYRLPNEVFRAQAHTHVMTDVLFFRKRLPTETLTRTPETLTLALCDGRTLTTPNWVRACVQEENPPLNAWFLQRPQDVIGTLEKRHGRYGDEWQMPAPAYWKKTFLTALERLPVSVWAPQNDTMPALATPFTPLSPGLKEGGLFIRDGRIHRYEHRQVVPLTHRPLHGGGEKALTEKETAWLMGYVRLREALKAAHEDQRTEGRNWQKSQAHLKQLYTAFVAQHGPILAYTAKESAHAETLTRRFHHETLWRCDAEGALVFALETLDSDGGIHPGAILSERVLYPPKKVTDIRDPQEALWVSLDEKGRLDIADVAARCQKSKEETLLALHEHLLERPGHGWQLKKDALSGDIVQALEEAQAAEALEPGRWTHTVQVLTAVQPWPLGPQDIAVPLGAPFVPTEMIEAFVQEVSTLEMHVTHDSETGYWGAKETTFVQDHQAKAWGCPPHRTPAELLEASLNGRDIRITSQKVLDEAATQRALAQSRRWVSAFEGWLFKDPQRAARVCALYNRQYNTSARPTEDPTAEGSFLTLPGSSPLCTLRPHQKKAVWRILNEGDVYLAHAVGAGKTRVLIAAAMEEKRLGLCQKPLLVVPNHMLSGFSSEFMTLYPGAHIMVADEFAFHTHRRGQFMAMAAYNRPDAIILTHSAFGLLGLSDDTMRHFIQKDIDALRALLTEAREQGTDRRSLKAIELRLENREAKWATLQERPRDAVMTFEQLGVDRLFVDEIHLYRKADLNTQRSHLKGIDPNGSDRTRDLFMKVDYLRTRHPHKRVIVGASGRPSPTP